MLLRGREKRRFLFRIFLSPFHLFEGDEPCQPLRSRPQPRQKYPPPPKKKLQQRIHFRKEDERLLRKLLAKVKAQADTVRRRILFSCCFDALFA